MEHEGRCCVCRKRFQADGRVGARQVTCGGNECRRRRKHYTNVRWRREKPEYFRRRRESKPDTRDRRAYSREYRASHPDHRERNTEHVRAHRFRVKACRVAVSSASREIRLTLRDQSGYVPIVAVSSTSREIVISLAFSGVSGPSLGNGREASM